MSKLMLRVVHFWSAMLDHLPVVATTVLPVYSKHHTIGSRRPKHMQRQTGSFAEWYLYKFHLVCQQPGRLQCSETDKPLHICVICCICLIADCILSNFFLILLQMLLSVNCTASAGAVTALPSVTPHIEADVQCLQALGEACSSIAAGHWLLSKLLGPHSQWLGDIVGDGLACSCIVMDSHLKSGREAFLVADLAVPCFLVVGGIWQQVQHCPSVQA